MLGAIVQEDFDDLIRRRQWAELREAVAELHPSDVAEIITDITPEDKAIVFRVLPRDLAAQVFSYLPLAEQLGLIQSLSIELTSGLLNQMTPDDRTRLLEEMPPEVTRKVIQRLSPEEFRSARELLGYPEESAGRYMTPEFVSIRPDMTAREALDHIRANAQGKETLSVVYAIDEGGKFVDDIRLSTLVLAPPDVKAADIHDSPAVSIPVTATREEVVDAFKRYDRVALPVTDPEGHMLGIITVDDVLDVAEAEATEEMQRMGGNEALDKPYLDVGFWEMIRKRGGWLCALFLGEMLTATAMGFFEREIERAVVLSLFIPLIISSGGNSGSQATSLIIRSLALKEFSLRDWWRVFGREVRTGLALGSLLGVVGFLRIFLWQHLAGLPYIGHLFTTYTEHYLLVGMTVMLALVGVVLWGTLAGSMLPFLLRRLGFDPATSSAPFVATLVDVTGLCIYFLVALAVLRSTLLAPVAPAGP